MNLITFTAFFALIHVVAYTIAGVVAYYISKDIYETKTRLMDYLRNMANPEEKRHVQTWVFPAQIVRGVLMAVVLWPVASALGEMAPSLRLLFFAGLAFVYTHFASAAPCPDNIEGFVYMREKYLQWSSFGRFQLEMALYTAMFAGATTFLLF
ncbi:MAG: hypothetical protein R6U25_02455 [Alkalispirochaeta sp.]